MGPSDSSLDSSKIDLNYSENLECFGTTADLLRPRKRQKKKHLSTITIGYIQTKRNSTKAKDQKRLRVLFDSGCGATLVNKKFVEKLKRTKHKATNWTTKAGSFVTNEKCKIKFSLPTLHKHREISWKVYVDNSKAEDNNYDMIIGRDLLHELGINLKFDTAEIEWDQASVAMQNMDTVKEDWAEQFEEEMLFMEDPSTTDAERIQEILDAKYRPADLEQIAEECQHLNKDEQAKLLNLLKKYEHLFDGTLGSWNTDPVDLELKDPNCKPYHAKPYPVPHSQEQQLREEIDRFVEKGILRKVNRSEWASPYFTVPKPDGTLRTIADLRELNKRIKRKPFPIPKITDILHKLQGFFMATSLDLNMGFHHIVLTPNASRLCTVVVPWGKYEYLRLPMGLCNSPDIFQEKMTDLMVGLEFARAYIDDLLVISRSSVEEHLQHLEEVLSRISEAGLKINASKSTFCTNELEYLGYVINRQGIRPKVKKVEAILQIEPPKNRKTLRSFIGMVNFYRDVWPQRAHILAPLSKMTSANVKWNWTEECQQAFDKMKMLIAKETLLTYPDFSKPFDIHTDASKVQLGACISQGGRPIAFYSRKLLPAQTRYTTTEKELLSIVETLKEFRTILLGQQLIVHTDHLNLTYKTANSDRVMRWRLYIEEYSPNLVHIQGKANTAADTISRLPASPNDLAEALSNIDLSNKSYPDTEESYSMLMYAHEPEDYTFHPLSYAHLDVAQQADKQLKKILKKDAPGYHLKAFHGGGKTRHLVCYKDKIVVPQKLQKHVTDWYHVVLCHPGINRTEESISQHLWWPKLRAHVTNYVKSCPTCQRNKRKVKKYGWLPPKEAEAIPWDKLCIDLIGPYRIRRKGQPDLICRCVTMIDPATGWFEIHQYDDKRSITVANIAEQEWFSRYPWPTQVTFDRGSEFIGKDFKQMIKRDYGIKGKPITVRNPQANATVERVHQVIGNIIRTFELEDNYLDEDDPRKGILSATAFAVRSTYHTTLQKSPGQLVFGRDMIFNIKHEANWEIIKKRKQNLINKNNERENSKRIEHEYKEGDLVMLLRGTENKYEKPYNGPFEIEKVNDNGTVRLTVNSVTDTYNVRRLYPYIDPNSSDYGGECNMRLSKRRRKTANSTRN